MEMKLQILDEFREWVKNHKDPMLKSRIAVRLDLIVDGNLGDHHSLGGDKSSQRRDIARARELSKEV